MSLEPEFVFDASAMLALIRGEAGAEKASEALDRAVISAVNLVEVLTRMKRYGASEAAIGALVGALGLRVVEWTEVSAWASLPHARLAWEKGISLGDRACLTLAMTLRATLVTADRVLAGAAPRALLIR